MKDINKNNIDILSAILTNAINLKNAGTSLLKYSLKDISIRPYALFLLYSSIEECGKFLLVLDNVNDNLTNKTLLEIGFYDHNSKIKRIIEIKKNSKYKKSSDQIGKFLRDCLRESRIYIDIKDKKIAKPEFVKNRQSLYGMASLVINCIRYCKIKLNELEN